jgi:membrane fusion protein, multidrug efflux system
VPSTANAGSRVYVPIGAIVEGNGSTARLFVLDKEYARQREIQVAFIEHDSVALTAGVAAGEQVITDGAQYLEDGERVVVFEPVAAGSPQP